MQAPHHIDGAARSTPDSEAPNAALRLEQLVLAVSRGEVAALSRLHELTAHSVFAVAYHRLRSREDAEEIVVDVYNHVWQRSVAYDPARGSVVAWLSIVTRNRAIDRLRRRREAISLDDGQEYGHAQALMDAALGPEQILSLAQSSTAVHLALQDLSTQRRNLVRLAFFEGLTHEEIAATIEMPLGTVKSHLRRALAALRHQLTVL